MQSVEALAEIFDFAAGLVQRVPKKPNVIKADLQNSTAWLWKQNASATDNHQYMTTPRLDPFDSEINFLAQGDCS